MSSHREAPPRVRALWQQAQTDSTLRTQMLSDPRAALREAGLDEAEIANLFSNHAQQEMTAEHWDHWTGPADLDLGHVLPG